MLYMYVWWREVLVVDNFEMLYKTSCHIEY
jgi:hypothetical protein